MQGMNARATFAERLADEIAVSLFPFDGIAQSQAQEIIIKAVGTHAGDFERAVAGDTLHQYVVPEWMNQISYQMQSVLLVATRGPDGVPKHHPAKRIHRAMRATLLRAAMRQRFLVVGEPADTFMGLDTFQQRHVWLAEIKEFFDVVDGLPAHYVSHMAHAAQIIAYKHPDPVYRDRWGLFYQAWCADLHVMPESEYAMDRRLSDWGTAKNRLRARGVPFESACDDQQLPRIKPDTSEPEGPRFNMPMLEVTEDMLQPGARTGEPTEHKQSEMEGGFVERRKPDTSSPSIMAAE